MKESLMEITQSRYAQSASTIASGDGTLVGDTIPDDKVRYIYGIIASSADGTAQGLAIYQGDAVDEGRGTLLKMDLSSTGPDMLGGSIGDPILVVRPNTAETTTQGNQIRIAHETSAVDVTILYWDGP